MTERLPEFLDDNRPYRPAPAKPYKNAFETRRDDAAALLETWGEFVPNKEKMRELVDQPVSMNQFWTLPKYMRALDKKLLAMQNYVGKGEPVDWPEHHVEHAVRVLTSLDQDRASEENTLGWSKATSSVGHWCNALLKIDRDRAIAVARFIVGKHKKQLETPAMRMRHPLPQDWRF
jgi:hypothetical protein